MISSGSGGMATPGLDTSRSSVSAESPSHSVLGPLLVILKE